MLKDKADGSSANAEDIENKPMSRIVKMKDNLTILLSINMFFQCPNDKESIRIPLSNFNIILNNINVKEICKKFSKFLKTDLKKIFLD